MKSSGFGWVAVTVSVCLLAMTVVGCEKEESAQPVKEAIEAAAEKAPEKVEAAAVAAAEFANVKCPIMGTDIKPGTVKSSLVREFKDQKVAFCCGACPTAWDKLSDEEKQTKLAAALPTAK